MQRPTPRGASSRKFAGFTLIELIIVLVILAALAAVVIPTLGFLKDQSDAAVTANTAQEVLNNLETYKASTGQYPARLDTLTNESGEYYTKMYSTSGGAYPYGEIVALPAYTFVNGGGITQFAVHQEDTDAVEDDPATTEDETAAATEYDPNESSTPRTVSQFGSAGVMVCTIDPQNAQPFFEGAAQDIARTAFPNQADYNNPVIPDGHTLVALGVGALNSAVGSTMSICPKAPEKSSVDADEYDRFIAVFDVQSDGGATGRGQVRLVMVLDPQFKPVATNLEYYKNSQPSDDQGLASST